MILGRGVIVLKGSCEKLVVGLGWESINSSKVSTAGLSNPCDFSAM